MRHLLALCTLLFCGMTVRAASKTEPVVVAYVTSWTSAMPDPTTMTHINYAFGHVNDQFTGVRIDNENRLRDIVALKRQHPSLRVMLSIGGWGSGRFSEMAASTENRKAFAADCRRLCDELGLDGIDIDWEYPTQSSAGISSSPSDTDNFTLLMRDLREALGNRLWLTIASVGSAQFIDFRSCQQYLDLVNVMAYDMGNAPHHHAALFRSSHTGWNTASGAVEAHRKAGVPDSKIVLGLPFYGRGQAGKYMKYADRAAHTEAERWDDQAKAPYLVDADGEMVFGFENPRSVAMKCDYIRQQKLRGAMYWEYADDNAQGDLRRAVWQGVLQSDRNRSEACRTAAKRLADVLTSNQKREDIAPDSFFIDWRNLKAEMLAEQDPTAQAIYRTAMAQLLCQNSWRSQRYDGGTTSHPDSLEEWSRQEYLAQAANLYAQALQDMEALHRCKVVDAKPLTLSGKDDSVFSGDLLYVVWQSARQSVPSDVRRQHLVPDFGDVIEVYRRHGLREATLLLRLDSLAEQDSGSREKALLRLRDDYADLPACAQVYLQLASSPYKTEREQRAILEEGIARYPKARQANELRSRLATLRQPTLTGSFPEMLYPGKDYDVPLQLRNLRAASLSFYLLPTTFAFSSDDKDGSQFNQVKRVGKLVRTLPIAVAETDPYVLRRDTLRFQAPSFGHYALVLDGTTKEKLDRKAEPEVTLCRVSKLAYMSSTMPDGKERVMVTDAMSGQPQSDVTVSFYLNKNNDYTLLSELTTDERGIVELASPERSSIYVKPTRGDDNAHEPRSIGWYVPSSPSEQLTHHLNVFTDRSIYRPGQMIYVCAVAYTQSHDQAPQAESARELALVLYDANGQEVVTRNLKTDDFGTCQDSLQLPEGGLPGRYRLSVGTSNLYIRVEEYRRPTFRVEFDEPPAISLPADSITLTGRALTYSQWPVADSRVTGTYQWLSSWWFKRFAPSETHRLDTLRTDADGRFSITVPINQTADELRWGQTLRLSVDVVSPEGETQSGSVSVPICSTPLRLRGNVASQQCREGLPAWRFDLYSSTDKPVQADILCQLSGSGRDIAFTLPAGCDTIPDALRSLPSGSYDLLAKAVVGADTASYRTTFTVFSITDTRLQGKHDLWLYAPSDVMSPDQPARFQLGTALPEAWLYVLVTGEGGLVRDTLLHMSDEATLLEVPYEPSFRHTLGVTLRLMHDGTARSATTEFHLRQPDMRLRMRWDTFRDQLQPGAEEHWRLTLTRPDGSPASANVVMSLYDASLDALSSYDMNLPVSLACHRNVLPSGNSFRHFTFSNRLALNFPMHFPTSQDYDFARLNEQYFQGSSPFVRGGGRTMRLRGLGDGRLYKSNIALEEVAVSALAAPKETGSEGRIAGLEIVDGLAEDDAGADEEVAATSLRSNLSELAFFRPQLRTDSQGQCAIDFTLPEGLTSWHLHGLAHTRDMLTAEWQETIVARKELMAELSLPRFLRSGDEASLIASVRNASEKRQRGEAVLEVRDAETDKLLLQKKERFDLQPGTEAVYRVPVAASTAHPILSVRWKATGEDGSDGEVRYLPVLSDMQNVTETKAYVLRGDTTLTLPVSALFAGGNAGATGKRLTIEHVAEPMLLALQALPSLTAPVRSDVLSVASAYYGGSLAQYIAQNQPALRTAIERWSGEEEKSVLESPLVRNQELADLVVSETPWMVEAQQQKASRQRLSSLFDDMAQEHRRMAMLSVLSARQGGDGSFSWFPGMRGSVWMTSEVATLLVRLGAVRGGILSVPERQVMDKALSFLEKEMAAEVETLKKEKSPVLSLSHLRFLYIYIMYRETQSASVRYLLSLLKKQADGLDREERALAAVVLQKAGEQKAAKALMPRLHTLLRHTDGTYLAYPGGSFTSIDRKVQTHVNLMEAVQTVEPEETDLLTGMTEWLLLQKRTQEWEQPMQSADAIYVLMQSPKTLLSEDGPTWTGQLSCDGKTLQLAGGTPYVRQQIEPRAGKGELRIRQKGAESMSWGAVFAQYQLPAAQAEAHREGMTIRREVSSVGDNQLQEGSRVHVRYTISADRDYEYVCLRAPRPAAAEPAQQVSGYRWQSGLGYYQAMHDASTDYYMDRLPRGTYVIEEDWLIARRGDFLLPPARLTCLYAPEFQSQTAGGKVGVK